MKFFEIDADEVIGGCSINGSVPYRFAVKTLYPLVNNLDIQRDALKTKFYSRLEADILKGCVMPPITVAFIIKDAARYANDPASAYEYIEEHIESGFILDGIQRLNTLKRASEKEGFRDDRNLQVNFLIADSRDRLLYRMITLNNGQKPMSARHQIDILANTFFDFSEIELQLVPEKGNGRVRAPSTFKKADFIKGYIAYLSDSTNIDNQKIIEEKMDELIATRIIDSDISSRKIEFSTAIAVVNRFNQCDYLFSWIRNQNNFIGFCVGIKNSYEPLLHLNLEKIEDSFKNFEKALSFIDINKINTGKVRREATAKYIESFATLWQADEYELIDKISEWI